MSDSPPIRRLTSTANSRKSQEELINAYEAEEERIINVLSRKLEQLREEKIDLENVLEAESESHVNRLNRELAALRLAQQQTQSANGTSVPELHADSRSGLSSVIDPSTPSSEVMLDAMRRENEHLRNRLVDTEREFIRTSRLNEIYREELIDLRRRLGLSLDSLIGLASPDPYSQPTHCRSFSSGSSSPSSSILMGPPLSHAPRAANGVPIPRSLHNGVPIPRPPSQIHRPVNHGPSEGNTPLSHSPSSDSPFPFSPVTSTNPASLVSNTTTMTTPPSSASLNSNPPLPYPSSIRTLSYPSVPPPSLSSSFGSPTIPYHIPHRDRDPSISPLEGLSRRGSLSNRHSSTRTGPGAGTASHNASRRASVERGARVAETGVLIPRSRAGSQSVPMLPVTQEAPNSAEEENSSGSGLPPTLEVNTPEI